MAVDEFGREVPAGRGRRSGGGSSPSPSYGSPSRAPDGAPTHLYQALPTSRYGRGEERSSGSSRKRKHRSESPQPSPGPRNHHGSHHHGSGRKSSSSPLAPHPSTLYADQPMLCQYLWKESNADSNSGTAEEDYDEYRRGYCLNYVRTFFNVHMDDSWFRARYSPLGRYRAALQEQQRAFTEADNFRSELEASLEKQAPQNDRCFFILKARLGGGIKQSRKLPADYGSYNEPGSPSKQGSQARAVSTIGSNSVPTSHVLALASNVLPVSNVPPFVTDQQLTMALMAHCTPAIASSASSPSLIIYSSTPSSTDLSRTAFFYAPEEVRKDIITQLNNLDRGGGASATDGETSHVPRKEDTFVPKNLDLTVECSDAYGRMEIDADGKGAAPEEGGVQPRNAKVTVWTEPLTPNIQVLSAALSSRDRIARDEISARRLGRALDRRRNVPSGNRLEDLLLKAIPSIKPLDQNEQSESDEDSPIRQDVEDSLDLSIAYLRRVHLLAFYNGCASACNVGDVLATGSIGNSTHPTATIHLRLANADDLLQQKDGEQQQSAGTATGEDAATAEAKPTPPKDLLVQRLDDAIAKALDDFKSWGDDDYIEDGPSSMSRFLVSEEIDTQAKEIEQLESEVEPNWIEEHALIDEDGRARCSFHFCRKLFKDSTFLKKHLIKKHSEFLRAEMAKTHDSYMMKAWDAQEQRPVPPILVDCGRAFSVVPSPVLGAADPMAADPEPDLWRRQEERRKQEEEDEQRRERSGGRNDGGDHYGDSMSQEDRPSRANFVDVDDMKEEKVEMAFDKVEVPIMPPKKKKKKKLL